MGFPIKPEKSGIFEIVPGITLALAVYFEDQIGVNRLGLFRLVSPGEWNAIPGSIIDPNMDANIINYHSPKAYFLAMLPLINQRLSDYLKTLLPQSREDKVGCAAYDLSQNDLPFGPATKTLGIIDGPLSHNNLFT